MSVSKSQQFLDQFLTSIADMGNNVKALSRDRYNIILQQVKSAKCNTAGKSQEDHKLMKRYDIISIGDIEKLIKKRVNEDDPLLYFVANEDLYDKMYVIHDAIGHGGINKMQHHVKKKFVNITSNCIEIFVSLCDECEARRNKMSSRSLVHTPIRSTEFNCRGQVDLIDYQSLPDGEYNWILNYQDHFTKFVHL